jgi:hypothetical protein
MMAENLWIRLVSYKAKETRDLPSTMWGYQEKKLDKPKREPSPDAESAGPWILDHPQNSEK